jgi:hypothetical protein
MLPAERARHDLKMTACQHRWRYFNARFGQAGGGFAMVTPRIPSRRFSSHFT